VLDVKLEGPTITRPCRSSRRCSRWRPVRLTGST